MKINKNYPTQNRSYLLSLPISALLLFSIVFVVFNAAAVRRTHRHKQTKISTSNQASDTKGVDSVRFTLTDTVSKGIHINQIVYTGYDKTQRSARESLYITNHTDRDITDITFEIAYYNLKRIEMHRREVSIKVDIPSGASRKVDFASWDPQHSYYYHKSKPSKNPGNTYDVAIRTKTIKYKLVKL